MSAKSTSSANDSRWTVSTHQGANPMAEMLEQYLASCGSLKRGQIVSGTVVRVNPTEVIVDVGAKCEGIVPEEDLLKLPPAEREAIRAGDEVLVYIVETEDTRGNVILSLAQARAARDWHEAQCLLESQETIEREVVACNKGGVIVRLGKVNGFVPGSQLSPTHAADRTATSSDSDDRWAGLIGKTLHLKVIEVDQQRNRLILSERRALREWRSSQRERLLNELTEGDVRQGRVINLADFGAFVDLGGIDGLIHLSELSWKRVAHPSEVLHVGQEVEVYVLGVDRERQRVALSLKRLQPDPWVTVEECYKEGQLVEGVITRLTRWGAFASIVGNEAIEGLIHISELDEGLVIHPREVIQPGKVVTLRVVSVDAAHRRLALSLKQAAQGECLDENWRELLAAEQPAPESPLSVALSEVMRPANDEEGL